MLHRLATAISVLHRHTGRNVVWNGEGQPFVAEHGQSGYDEINLIEPGEYYGWPIDQGYEAGSGRRKALASSEASTWAPSGVDIATR